MSKTLVFLALLVGGGAAAQVAKDPLQEICTGFLAQSGAGVSGDRQKLCSCLVAETQKRLTRKEMEIYHQAMASGGEPPPAIMEKVVGVATVCLTQAR
ncbi:MAG: hypothetical protein IT566_04680 [Rhodospirillaceae bacterium]|nr:hypothetical protein [Rhodospirillaceae bacterium]